jgi:hypothetical protein
MSTAGAAGASALSRWPDGHRYRDVRPINYPRPSVGFEQGSQPPTVEYRALSNAESHRGNGVAAQEACL